MTRAEHIAGEGPYTEDQSVLIKGWVQLRDPDGNAVLTVMEPHDAYETLVALNRAYTRGQQELCARMEAICKRRYRDGDAVYFRTFGMSDEEDGQFLVRINRMFLHKAPTLMAALESAMNEWEESDDPNDQIEPLPSPPNPEQR